MDQKRVQCRTGIRILYSHSKVKYWKRLFKESKKTAHVKGDEITWDTKFTQSWSYQDIPYNKKQAGLQERAEDTKMTKRKQNSKPTRRRLGRLRPTGKTT
ncbi:hypothetical protein WA026_009081 [Henosepilachna vigintioctopunctata]|uniref:Uncharacterized protein n=1 Tax=Henosepilachna vigintioctopunctata TaxID=420089 RepID=A0AAW1UVF3_9CUCU